MPSLRAHLGVQQMNLLSGILQVTSSKSCSLTFSTTLVFTDVFVCTQHPKRTSMTSRFSPISQERHVRCLCCVFVPHECSTNLCTKMTRAVKVHKTNSAPAYVCNQYWFERCSLHWSHQLHRNKVWEWQLETSECHCKRQK